MAMARETRLTIETESLLILRGRSPLWAWCREWGGRVEMIPLDGVGVISNLTSSEVELWMQSEDLHHTTTSDGASLICLNSMLKRVQNQKFI